MKKLLDLIYKYFDIFSEKFGKLLVKDNGKKDAKVQDATTLGIIVNYFSLPILCGILSLLYYYFWIMLVIILIISSLTIYRKYR